MVGLQLHVSLATGSILRKEDIHDFKELFNPLVLPQVFTPLDKERVFFLIMASDDDALWFSDRGHDFYL